MVETSFGEARTRTRQERVREVDETGKPGAKVTSAITTAPPTHADRGLRKDWRKTALCFQCGKSGHIADQCPERGTSEFQNITSGEARGVGQSLQIHTPKKVSPRNALEGKAPESVCACLGHGDTDDGVVVKIETRGEAAWVPVDTGARSIWVDRK